MVARRKKAARVVYRYKRKRMGKSAKSAGFGGFMSKLGKPLGAMGYGAVREKISDAIANSALGKKLPASQFTDELVMLAGMWGARKMGAGKVPILGSAVRAGEVVEYARIGQTFADLYMNKTTSSSSGSSSGALW